MNVTQKLLSRRKLDGQEEKIARMLIRNPRLSDNAIGRMAEIPAMTVNRKRKRLEDEGLLSYFAAINMGPKGTGRFRSRYLYLIKFKLADGPFIPHKDDRVTLGITVQ